MGNKITTSNYKWSSQNTTKKVIHKHTETVHACAAFKDPQNDDRVIITSRAWYDVAISNVHTKQKGKTGKMKVISQRIKIQNSITSVYTNAISPSCVYHLILRCPSCIIKFINDDLFLISLSNCIQLCSIINTQLAVRLNDLPAHRQIFGFDLVNIHNKYIIAIACESQDDNYKVYIQDISHHITNNMDETYSCPSQAIGDFNNRVCCVSFTSNGDYLAAGSWDSTYGIFYKNCKYDSFWKITIIEWSLLTTVYTNKLYTVNVIKWIDDNTVIAAGRSDKKHDGLLATHVKQSKNDPLIIKTINECIFTIIDSFSNINMNWIGLTKYISNVILSYISDHNVYNYNIGHAPGSVTCMASCKYGTNNSKSMFIVGTAKNKLYAYFHNDNLNEYKLELLDNDNDSDEIYTFHKSGNKWANEYDHDYDNDWDHNNYNSIAWDKNPF